MDNLKSRSQDESPPQMLNKTRFSRLDRARNTRNYLITRLADVQKVITMLEDDPKLNETITSIDIFDV